MRARERKDEGGFTWIYWFVSSVLGTLHLLLHLTGCLWYLSKPLLPWGRVSVMWTQPRANVVTENCLLLHQFDEWVFGMGERVGCQQGRKMLFFNTYCLQIFLLLLLAAVAPLFYMVDPHYFMLPSKHLHAQSPPMFLTFTLNCGMQSPPQAFPCLSWFLLSSFLI